MKKLKFTNTAFLSKALASIVLMLGITQCIDEPELWTPASADLQMTEYIVTHSSEYSEFKKAMDKGSMSSLLSTRGPFTLFLPDNEAMFAYYEKEGVGSIDDFDADYCRSLVLNHVTPSEVYSSNVPVGSLPEPNGLGDYLVTELPESEIVINKKSHITDRDIITANGIIHRIDRVIDMVTDDILVIMEENGAFSIFIEGLKRAGISDTLGIILIPYGKQEVRVRYTLLAVPDSVYAEANILSIDDLIAAFDDGNGELDEVDNGFYKYMDYHCLEGSFFTSDLITGVYPTVSRENVVTMRVSSEFMINYVAETDEYTGIIIEGSNIPSKNGVIHSVNTILEDVEPTPEPYIFEVTDFPDLGSQECYRTYLKNFFDGDNSFEKIKWKTADYLQYYFKTSEGNLRNSDCIVMSEGFWELEVTIPRIKRGKYQIHTQMKKGWNRANVAVYIDGEKIDQILELNFESLQYEVIYLTDVDWDTTEEHTFKLKTVFPGIIMWDYLEFRPITE